jgi:hypothetical protein
MPQISIAYTVAVQVVVDPDEPGVYRIVVIDEAIQQDRDGYHEYIEAGREKKPSEEEVAAAYHIAENSEWPSWDFGW